MIKTVVAYTGEIDDETLAIDELKEQLKLDENLKKNAVGIIACHYEFVLSGVVKAICEALPFDVVGTITSTQAVPEQAGSLLLTLMVMTSDDVRFATAMTPSLKETPGRVIETTYREATQDGEAPALMLCYAPFMVENSGDEYVEVLTKVSGGVPCFGTLAVDDTPDFSKCFMIYNGEHYTDRMGMIFLLGDVKPKFYIATISEGKILDKAALVTRSEGHVLMEVNDRPVSEFFENLGLTKASETAYAMTSLPFMLDYGDGTPPVSKVFIGLTPERYAICAGAMPEGSTLYVGVFDKDDVIKTTGAAVDQALLDTEGASGLLIYSCISRNMSLGAEMLLELQLIQEKVGDGLSFMMAYSGGEICPTVVGKKGAVNRFHNNAFIACIF